ncbi:MAG: hypothetical protein AAB736_02415, partial [Patescibacteria group bacterium]
MKTYLNKTRVSGTIAALVFILSAISYSSAQAESPKRLGGVEYSSSHLALISEEVRQQLELIDAGIPPAPEVLPPLPETTKSRDTAGQASADADTLKSEAILEDDQLFATNLFQKFANFLTTSLTGDVIKQSAGVVSSYASSIADFFSSAFTDGKSSIVQSIADIGQFNKKVGADVENKTAGVLSSVTGFFTSLFSDNSISAPKTIIPLKESGDETIPPSSNTRPPSFESAVAVAEVNQKTTDQTNPSAATAVESVGQATTPDITKNEVLDLIQQSKDNNQSLINFLITATEEKSLSLNKSVSTLEKRISDIQSNNARQLDKPGSTVSRTDADIKNLSGVTVADPIITGNFLSNGSTYIGDADADTLAIRSSVWSLTSTATSTVAMTNGL